MPLLARLLECARATGDNCGSRSFWGLYFCWTDQAVRRLTCITTLHLPMTLSNTKTPDTVVPSVLLANPRGFCAGVNRAIAIVEQVLKQRGAPIYVRNDVVHNRYVVESLRRRGVVFVGDIDEIPPGAVCIFSAHGVSRSVQDAAVAAQLQVYDATCPLVTKVHVEVAKYARRGYDCILIGHSGHPEVEGTMGQFDGGGSMYLVENEADARSVQVNQPDRLACATQTTLSVSDTAAILNILSTRFPDLHLPRRSDICYATQNRQDAVIALAEHCDLILVVGSPNSSNSNRLRELASARGARTFMLDDPQQLQREWLQGHRCIGVTAGASAPELLVQRVVEQLAKWGVDSVRELTGIVEDVEFVLPSSLKETGP